MKSCLFLLIVVTFLGALPSWAQPIDLANLQARAAKGDAEAELELGRAYHLGHGAPRDFAKALALYHQSAAQGNAKAMYNLGFMYHRGQGVAKDEKAARDWFQKAADLGLQAAQLQVGLAYYNGSMVVNQDYAAAAKWLKLAAAQNDAPKQTAMAANALGSLYEHGWGVSVDGPEAEKWYGQAADLGDVHGRSNLGRIYNEGMVVKKDPVKAYMWTKLAASQGEPLATHLYSEAMAAKAFTPDQIAEGDRLLADYQAKHNGPAVTAVPLVAEPETMAAFPRTNATVAPTAPTGTPSPATPAPAPSSGSVIAPVPPAGK
jgi:TPR repeat protein